jgi:C1A family cysteine protease
MKKFFVHAILVVAPHIAFAQGAVLESLEDLKGVSAPASFRGTIPDRADLSSRMPVVRSQFTSTSTCVSWAATYAAASLALRARGFAPSLTLSPSFTYNHMARDQWCASPTKVSSTLNMLRDVGALPIEEFAFDGGWCGRVPTAAELERAGKYKIRGWAAFDARDIDQVKEQVARGVPVIFGMRWTAKMSSLHGDAVFEEDDTPGEGHVTVVVGYDDSKKAFLIQNSFGPTWGTRGYGWFGYEFWKRNVGTGYVIE